MSDTLVYISLDTPEGGILAVPFDYIKKVEYYPDGITLKSVEFVVTDLGIYRVTSDTTDEIIKGVDNKDSYKWTHLVELSEDEFTYLNEEILPIFHAQTGKAYSSTIHIKNINGAYLLCWTFDYGVEQLVKLIPDTQNVLLNKIQKALKDGPGVYVK